jgi:ribonuclease HI
MEIYTDGSCLGNPGPGGWAAISSGFEISGGSPHTTNNIMELTAVIRCLEHVGLGAYCTVYTDSCYVKNGITKWIVNWRKNGWKTTKGEPIKNRDLWVQLDDLVGDHVTWRWVKAHNGNPFNERVDRLAREQAHKQKKEDTV